MIKASDIKKGQHFWAKMQDQLAMMMRDQKGDFYVCGGWECPIHEKEFEVISLVAFPEGLNATNLYYL